MREPRSLQLAMDFVKGNETAAVNSDPEVLLSRLKEQLIADHNEKTQAQIDQLRKVHAKKQASTRQEVRKLETSISDLQNEVLKRAAQNDTIFSVTFLKHYKNFRIANRFSKLFAGLILAILTFITSSVVLDPLDKTYLFPGWTFTLSAINSIIVVGCAIYFDLKSWLDTLWMDSFKRSFQSEISSLGLEESSTRVAVDWKTGTATPIETR